MTSIDHEDKYCSGRPKRGANTTVGRNECPDCAGVASINDGRSSLQETVSLMPWPSSFAGP